MELGEDQVMRTMTRTFGRNLGRGVRSVKGVMPGAVSTLGASVGVGAVWGGIAGLTSLKRYSDGKLSGKDAVLTTAGESTGMGLAAGIGLLASNAVRASLLMTATTSIAPIVVGVTITAGAKVLWDRTIKKHI